MVQQGGGLPINRAQRALAFSEMLPQHCKCSAFTECTGPSSKVGSRVESSHLECIAAYKIQIEQSPKEDTLELCCLASAWQRKKII